MSLPHRVALPLVLAAGGLLVSNAALAQSAEVLHWWTSAADSKAIGVFATEFNSRGGAWVDTAIAGGAFAAKATSLTRIVGGKPPTAMQAHAGPALRRFAEEDMLTPLDDIALAGKWKETMPPLLYNALSYKGSVFAVPVDLQGVNYTFYNKKIFDQVKVAPPTSWDEFFVAADKIKSAGYIALAQGGNKTQYGQLFMTVMLGVGGIDFYKQVFLDKDVKAASGDKMVKAFETYRRLVQYTDSGMQNRTWPQTTRLVVENKAAMQITGDWALGEFAVNKLTVDKDFGCLAAPGTGAGYIVSVDVFAFPKNKDSGVAATQKKLASVMMDPPVQAEFARIKGSNPARADANVAQLHQCTQIGREFVRKAPDAILPNWQLSFSADAEGQITDLVSNFWSSSSMTAAQATKDFAAIIKSSKV